MPARRALGADPAGQAKQNPGSGTRPSSRLGTRARSGNPPRGAVPVPPEDARCANARGSVFTRLHTNFLGSVKQPPNKGFFNPAGSPPPGPQPT